MYRILGGDGKEYGPVSADQVREWVAQGRANRQSRVRAEDSAEWRTLADFPELNAPATPPPLGAGSPAPDSAAYVEAVLAREARLDVGACFSRAMELYKAKFGMFFVVMIAFIGIQFGIAILSAIPFVGALVSLASLVVTGPLTGGLYYAMIRGVRGGEARVDDLFTGFRRGFVQLLLVYILSAVFAFAAAIPGLLVGAAGVLPWVIRKTQPDAGNIVVMVGAFLLLMAGVLIVKTLLFFALPLAIDRQLEFWPAMQLSRKVNARVFWPLVGLMICAGLVYLVGALVCCVGAIFTGPLAFLMMVCGYEQLFGEPPAAPKPA